MSSHWTGHFVAKVLVLDKINELDFQLRSEIYKKIHLLFRENFELDSTAEKNGKPRHVILMIQMIPLRWYYAYRTYVQKIVQMLN